MPCTFIPVAVTPNPWIIPSNPKTLGSAIMIICPDKVTWTVPLQHTIHVLKLSPACSFASRYFQLTPCYGDHTIMINVSLDAASNKTIYISTWTFEMWQHFNSNWTSLHLHNFVNVPEFPVIHLYEYMIDPSEPVHSFTVKDELWRKEHTWRNGWRTKKTLAESWPVHWKRGYKAGKLL